MTAREASPTTVGRSLPPADPFGRDVDDEFVRGEVDRGAWAPLVVAPEVSGMRRPMTIFLARRQSDLIKWAWHGDKDTFCPPTWADIGIGSGACGFGCRSCFLMLTFRAMRDPLRPLVYVNGDDFEREVRRWLGGDVWWRTVKERGKKGNKRVPMPRPKRGAIGLGIDCADSLLWEAVTGHARRLVAVFADATANQRGTPLVLLTKSANIHFLAELADHLPRTQTGRIPNVVVSMSLNPEPVADLWEGEFPDTGERMTPPISERLRALRAAQDMGFEVRARIDPILTPPGWKAMYEEFFAEMAHDHALRPTMLTLGAHRERTPQLDTFREKWGLPAKEFEPERASAREGTHVHVAHREEIYREVRDLVARTFAGIRPQPWVSLCKETHDVRRTVGLCNANCNCLRHADTPRRKLQIFGRG